MKNNPFFSIITASLNNASSIGKTLESVKNQIFPNYEHIVVDGSSLDNTVELLKKYERHYPLNWISEPDDGIADALNKALLMATGKYILVLQTDDALLNAAILESAHAIIRITEKDIYSFPVLLDRPSRRVVLRKSIRLLWYNRFKFIFPHQGCFVKRSVFDKIGGFNTSFKIAMDYDFFYRALKHKCSVKFYPKPVALMGGAGIGTVIETVPFRLKEEQLVQAINEDNSYWRIAQKIFWWFYIPYKKKYLKGSH